MARPVKWSRDLHSILERAKNSRTETWSRVDIEKLFDVGRASAQTLMKAIGEVQPVGGAHFIERTSLLEFLDSMIKAPSIDEALRDRVLTAASPPRPKALRIALPADLRSATLCDLPVNVRLSPGRLEITADSAVGIMEGLAALAQIMQNDLESVRAEFEPKMYQPPRSDGEMEELLRQLRRRSAKNVPPVCNCTD